MHVHRIPPQLLIMIAGLLCVSPGVGAQKLEMQVVPTSQLKWTDLAVPGFAAGTKLAAVVGDPSVPDQPYTLRLKFPDGYRFPAHYHPKAENVTVLSGSFLLAMGAEEGEKLNAYSAGDYLFIPPDMPHYGGAKGETVIQLHGIGPFEIKLVKPVTKEPQ
jgi:quercetin dioxygenase-like cupin family protein